MLFLRLELTNVCKFAFFHYTIFNRFYRKLKRVKQLTQRIEAPSIQFCVFSKNFGPQEVATAFTLVSRESTLFCGHIIPIIKDLEINHEQKNAFSGNKSSDDENSVFIWLDGIVDLVPSIERVWAS
jgi:hypothetical protein